MKNGIVGCSVVRQKKKMFVAKKRKKGCSLAFYFGVRATFRARRGVSSRVRFSCLRAISSGCSFGKVNFCGIYFLNCTRSRYS